MTNQRLADLSALGTSVWIDFIDRQLLQSGGLDALIRDKSVVGLTSNPTIFEKAFAASGIYDDDIASFARQGLDSGVIFERIAVADIQAAADSFRATYDSTDGRDGYVSLEVSPVLANDTDGTIDEARRLHAAVDRPNLFVKVPATLAGLPAIRALLRDGINVNVTLIFAVERYQAVLEAYVAALEDRIAAGQPIDRVASVASFFVSRVDALVDGLLPKGAPLAGQAAIANARLAYQHFREITKSPRWQAIAAKGGKVQRPLWASTSTKNPAYRDVIYVEQLAGPDTVNTMPQATLDAFADHGEARRTVDYGVAAAQQTFADLADAGIDVPAATEKLEVDGVKAFADSFASLMASLDGKREELLAGAR